MVTSDLHFQVFHEKTSAEVYLFILGEGERVGGTGEGRLGR